MWRRVSYLAELSYQVERKNITTLGYEKSQIVQKISFWPQGGDEVTSLGFMVQNFM